MRMNGRVAQLVEQRIENPRAEGSSPPPTTTNSKPVFVRAFSLYGGFPFRRAAFLLRADSEHGRACFSVRSYGDCCARIEFRVRVAFWPPAIRPSILQRSRFHPFSLPQTASAIVPPLSPLRFEAGIIIIIIQRSVFRALEACAEGRVRILLDVSRNERRKRKIRKTLRLEKHCVRF